MAATIAPVLVPLIPVIIGGIIGLAGGLVGPPFLHRLQQKAEKKEDVLRSSRNLWLHCTNTGIGLEF